MPDSSAKIAAAAALGLAVGLAVPALCSLLRPRGGTRSGKAKLRVLVLHGLNLNTRGYENIERFGTMTLAEYNTRIEAWASELGVDVATLQSNEQTVLAAKLAEAAGGAFDAVVINPGGFVRPGAGGDLATAVGEAERRLPIVECHATNCLRVHGTSPIGRVATGLVFGFGVDSYRIAMREVLLLLERRRRGA